MKKFLEPKRLVVKIGTSILTAPSGRLARHEIERVGREVLSVLRLGKEVVLVSSGAIASGMEIMGLHLRPKELPKLQACAAIGQGRLVRLYDSFFAKRRVHTAQVLLTRDALEDRERYLNARNTLVSLLHLKVLPIVNENDTVATEEIRFGDNDTLSALVAGLVDADLLVILSDVDGFYLKDKTKLDKVKSLKEIDHHLEENVLQIRSEHTIGGAATKLEAARLAMQAGIPMILANGREEGILKKIVEGESHGTVFHPGRKRRQRKNWLAFAKAYGTIQVDDGAREALALKRKSLLARGIIGISGDFEMGAAVRIVDSKNREFARGLVNYSKEELSKIQGKRTDEIQGVLGYKYFDEVVHRDNLVVLEEGLP